jgi:hypothetical protein
MLQQEGAGKAQARPRAVGYSQASGVGQAWHIGRLFLPTRGGRESETVGGSGPGSAFLDMLGSQTGVEKHDEFGAPISSEIDCGLGLLTPVHYLADVSSCIMPHTLPSGSLK